MSDLPDGWEWTTLGEIAETALGKMLDRSKSAGDNMVPYLRNLNVQWGRFDLRDVSMMDVPSDQQAHFEVKTGDLMVCEGGDVGRCAVWQSSGEYIAFQKALHRVRPHEGVHVWYLRYLLENYRNTKLIGSLATGSTIKHLPQERLRSLPVPLPSLGEQTRIVEALDMHLSRLDAGLETASRAGRKVAVFRRKVYDWFALGSVCGSVSSDSAESLVELRGRVAKKLDYSKLPALPRGWRWRVAREVCESINSGSTPKSDLMTADSGEIPFLKVYNLTRDGRVDFTVRPTFVAESTHQSLLKRSQVQPGDVLTNIVGPPLGKTAVVPNSWPQWNINQAIVSFRAGDGITPDWLAVVLQSPYVLGILEGTAKATAGQFNISLSTCRELPLPVPPIVEQIELVQELRALISEIEVSSAGVDSVLRQADALRRSLLAEAFGGGLTRQEPGDEPALAILEKINAKALAVSNVKRRRRHVATKTAETGSVQETLL